MPDVTNNLVRKQPQCSDKGKILILGAMMANYRQDFLQHKILCFSWFYAVQVTCCNSLLDIESITKFYHKPKPKNRPNM